MNKNPKLLRDSLETILANRDLHNQGAWIALKYATDDDDMDVNACGTTMCLAGFVAVQAGAEQPTMEQVMDGEEWYLTPDGRFATEDDYWDNEDVIRVNKWAQDRLGLNFFESEYLFYFFGDAEELAHRANQVASLWESGKEMTSYTIAEES